MKKESKSDLKSSLVTGVSASVGAVGGYVAADVIAAEIVAEDARDSEDEDCSINYETNVPGRHHESVPGDSGSAPVHEHSEQASVHLHPEALSSDAPDVSVVESQTVETESGEHLDVTIAEVDGAQAVLADVNDDGVSEVLASDQNGDGRLEGAELAGIVTEDIATDEDMDMYGGDYVNDADMDSYMA